MEVTNEVLLAAIKEQPRALNDFVERTDENIRALSVRCGKIEERLSNQDNKVSLAFEEQSKRIDNLYAKVNALAEEKLIKTVINADGNKEAALQRDEAYDTFEEAGFGRLEALRALKNGGKLSTTGDPGHKYTKLVRIGNEVVRTVVVLL